MTSDLYPNGKTQTTHRMVDIDEFLADFDIGNTHDISRQVTDSEIDKEYGDVPAYITETSQFREQINISLYKNDKNDAARLKFIEYRMSKGITKVGVFREALDISCALNRNDIKYFEDNHKQFVAEFALAIDIEVAERIKKLEARIEQLESSQTLTANTVLATQAGIERHDIAISQIVMVLEMILSKASKAKVTFGQIVGQLSIVKSKMIDGGE